MSPDRGTLVFPSMATAKAFATAWGRKTLTGHDMSAVRPDGSVEVTVYGAYAEQKEWIASYVESFPVETVARTPSERKAAQRARAKALGYVQREYYATPGEHDRLKNTLRELRADKTMRY